MTEFLTSLKADLLDRRLLPLVGLVLVGLLAAIAYVALGGGSAPSTPSASVPPAPIGAPVGGIAVSAANPSSEKAVAETTDGVAVQRKGSSHNPFTLLPGGETKGTSASSASSSANSGAASGSGSSSSSEASKSTSGSSGSGSGGGSGKSSKPKTVYHVTALFGEPSNQLNGEVNLTPYLDMKLFTPLPSSNLPLLVFRGVTAKGQSATFTVVGETILHGGGTCLPSPLQCQALDLKKGQSETLEYLASGASTVTVYEVKVLSITSSKVSASSAKVATVSRAGRRILHEDRLMSIPDLKPSSQAGVLVFAAPRRASLASVHAHRRSHR